MYKHNIKKNQVVINFAIKWTYGLIIGWKIEKSINMEGWKF